MNIPEQGQVIVKDELGRIDDTWYRWLKSPWRQITWTPELYFGGVPSAGIGYHADTKARLFIWGPLVHLFATLRLTAKGAGVGTATIVGLPPSLAATSALPFPLTHSFNNMTAGVGDTMTRMYLNVGVLQPAKIAAGVYVDLTDSDFTNTSLLRFAGAYYLAP
jgi:hypothetical protein